MRAILTWHSIDDSGSAISVPEAAFRRQIDWLAMEGVAVCPLGETAAGAGDDRHAVALTFDDGFDSTYQVAWPILRERGFPFTVFVVADHVGATNDWGGRKVPGIPTLPLMSWDAIGQMREAGVDIGAHTRRHPQLPTCSPAEVEDELSGSALRIGAETGKRPDTFAYPYGLHDHATRAAAGRVFSFSCTTEHRPLRTGEDMTQLPRIDMFYFRDRSRFGAWGSPALRGRLWLRGQARRARAFISRTASAA
jgi:peptidoglycan/xylan/chitin deacetylase (PgdA/CDA1 family)